MGKPPNKKEKKEAERQRKLEEAAAAAKSTAEAIAEANVKKAAEARFNTATAEKLAADLALENIAVAKRAAEELAIETGKVAEAVDGHVAALKRQLEATLALAKASEDSDEKVGNILKATNALESFGKTQEETAKSAEKAKTAQDSFGTALEGTIRTMTGMTSGNETLIGSWLNMGKASKKLQKEIDALEEELEDVDLSVADRAKKTQELTIKQEQQKKGTGSLTDKIKEYVKNINPVASIVSNIQQATFGLAMANDAATAAFNMSSGAAGAYDDELVTLQLSNRANGISTAEMGESYGALMGNLSGFGVMAESERMRLGELGAQFAKAGVSGADFAGTLQTMTRGFGMSTRAATGMQEEAMELAQTLGKDVGQVMSEMNAALPQLASYGDDAVDMFFDLEKQAQRTGLAVGDLIGIAGNYRTFDSAAEAAGNLNAVLGTQLFSTMGLLEAQLEGPEAVIAYMSENLSDSIGDWDSLNTFQKDAVANAAGMNVEQMNHLMNQKNMTKEEKNRAKSLQETMAAGRSLWQELTIVAQNFAITITPLMDFLVGTFQNLNKFIGFVREEAGWIADIFQGMFVAGAAVAFIGVIITLAKAFMFLGKAAMFFTSFSSPWKLALGLAAFGGAWAIGKKMMGKSPDKHQRGGLTSGREALVGEGDGPNAGPEGWISPDGEQSGIIGANGPTTFGKGELPTGSKIIPHPMMKDFARAASNGGAAAASRDAAMTGFSKQSAAGASKKASMGDLAKQSANGAAQTAAMTGLAKQSAAGTAQNAAMTNLVKKSDGSGLRTKAPQSENIINNTGMTALASQATNRSISAANNGAAMASAVASIKDAVTDLNNRPIEVTTNPVMLDFKENINDHFNEPGSRPIRLRS